jgi:hypothetical protein
VAKYACVWPFVHAKGAGPPPGRWQQQPSCDQPGSPISWPAEYWRQAAAGRSGSGVARSDVGPPPHEVAAVLPLMRIICISLDPAPHLYSPHSRPELQHPRSTWMNGGTCWLGSPRGCPASCCRPCCQTRCGQGDACAVIAAQRRQRALRGQRAGGGGSNEAAAPHATCIPIQNQVSSTLRQADEGRPRHDRFWVKVGKGGRNAPIMLAGAPNFQGPTTLVRPRRHVS